MPSRGERVRVVIWLVVVASVLSTSARAIAAPDSSIWSGAATPQSVDNDTNAVELGVRFRSNANGYITGIRFYKFASNTGTHIGNLWSSAGALLASATFTAETTSGWQQVTFASPVAVTANTTYIASYHTNVGQYAVDSNYFTSSVDNGPLHAFADGDGGSNGLYRYAAGSAFPTNSWQATNYWVDVVFTTSLGGGTTSLKVNSVSPPPGATGVNVASGVSASLSGWPDFASVNTTTFQLRDPSGSLVSAQVWSGGESGGSFLTPLSPLAPFTTYTATLKGGPNGVKDQAGNTMIADYSWWFTTAAGTPPPPATCPCSLWNGTTGVGGMDGDASAVELGVRFRSDQNGYITALRFYKHTGNTGTHTGSLWSNTGTRLATATFTGETASGWQQVTLSPPLHVTADTSYVASYHTDTGHYAATGNYFASGFDRAPLHAVQDGADGGNGVYRYGASGFPAQSYGSANYWVDVVFSTTVSSSLSVGVTSMSPGAGATGVSTTTVVRATISGYVSYPSVNTNTFQLRDPAGNVVPATVGFGGESQTFPLTPLSPLAYNTTYSAIVKGGPNGVTDNSGNGMAADYAWSFTTGAAPSPPPANCPCTIWNTASTTAAGPDGDASAVELGVRFRSESSGYVTGVRFYKQSTNTGTHVGNLWSNSGTLLATATFANESTSGWQQVTFGTPVAITANTTYVASYHTNVGHYAANLGYFAAGFDNAPLHALRDGVDGPSGVYAYGAASRFPDQTYQSTNYWVDVVYATTVGEPDLTPPTVASTSPTSGSAGLATTVWVTATFSESMDPATINGNTVQLRDGSGALVAATVTYSVPNGTAILQPTGGLANGTTYTATVKGGSADPRVKDLAGNALAANYSWSFTTVAAVSTSETSGLGCPCSLWNASAEPTIDNESSSIEVGLRFQSDASGFITGFRFYKGLENTGNHVGSLWTNTGTLLARATFASETASGWQQVDLPTPVAITANTPYVVSYHANTGHYAATAGYFAVGFDNSPLHALRDGLNGSNGLYRYNTISSFPYDSYNSTNYWVDVVFSTTASSGPTVNSVTPSAGATGVNVGAVITATFNEMMEPSTVNTSTFELRDATGALVPASVLVGGETPTVSLMPSSPLAHATTYTATVKGGASGVQSLTGSSMTTNYSWSFTTAP